MIFTVSSSCSGPSHLVVVIEAEMKIEYNCQFVMMKTFGLTSRADEKFRQLAVIMAVLVFIYIETRSEVLLKLPAH